MAPPAWGWKQPRFDMAPGKRMPRFQFDESATSAPDWKRSRTAFSDAVAAPVEDLSAGDEEPIMVNASLTDVLAQLSPSASYEHAAQEAVLAMTEAVQKVFGREAAVMTFGSFVQGVPLHESDLDLCVDVPGLEVPEPVGPNGKPGNDKQVGSLRRLLRVLREARHKFRIIEERLFKHIRVPIVILAFKSTLKTEIETDISVGTSYDGVEKGHTDRLIRRIVSRTPAVLPMMRLVKQWAKVKGLNKAYEGFLNSLGWALLVIYFFFQRGDASPGLFYDEEESERDPLPPPLSSEPHEEPSVDDLAAFFEMVAEFDSMRASPREAGQGPLGISLLDASEARGEARDMSPFYLEDPGIRMAVDKVENVARALKDYTWSTIMRKCKEEAQKLRTAAEEDSDAVISWADALLRPTPSAPSKPAMVAWQGGGAQQQRMQQQILARPRPAIATSRPPHARDEGYAPPTAKAMGGPQPRGKGAGLLQTTPSAAEKGPSPRLADRFAPAPKKRGWETSIGNPPPSQATLPFGPSTRARIGKASPPWPRGPPPRAVMGGPTWGSGGQYRPFGPGGQAAFPARGFPPPTAMHVRPGGGGAQGGAQRRFGGPAKGY
eukprot:TRINITY_DN42760_c0_g1_i1.p1 TRINITY_DN42760_c0_g1~~TRINITY_DN42760_c0_g1_i1.p1  ORF type:complete len:605 (-),score=105.61 TRINITY_DN42760_c0_g1_i1:46-1860(-)